MPRLGSYGFDRSVHRWLSRLHGPMQEVGTFSLGPSSSYFIWGFTDIVGAKGIGSRLSVLGLPQQGLLRVLGVYGNH